MESPPLLTRPADVYSRRHVLSIALGAIALGLSFTTGMMLADEGATTTITIPVPVVAMAPAPTPATPAPIQVTVEAPAPPPVAPEEPHPWRAISPSLDAACFGRDNEELSESCQWDSGFPAISADGRLIAELAIDGPMGPIYGALVLHDVATSREVRRIPFADPLDTDQDSARARGLVAQRVAIAQRVLATGKFRTLRSLGDQDGLATTSSSELRVTGDVDAVHAEWSGASMRLVDPTTHAQLWRHRFSAPPPTKHVDPGDDCGGWDLARVGAWWDPETRVVVGRLIYFHGGCMCGESSVLQVFAL